MRILVLGAAGYVGSNLVPRLLAKGYRVRCLVRRSDCSIHGDAELIQGNALDAEAVDRAMVDVDRIVYLIHSMAGQKVGFEQLDLEIAANVVKAASKHRVEQIVYLGGLGRRHKQQTPHLQSRHAVADILRSSAIPVVELRAAVIVGAGSSSFEMIRFLVARLPVMICPRWVAMKTQPISLDDALAYIVESLSRYFGENRSYDIGGCEVLSYREMMVTVARLMKLRRLIIPVPVLTPWLSSHWVNLVTPVAAPLARALIESVRSETVCESDAALRGFDIKPIGFSQAAELALGENGKH